MKALSDGAVGLLRTMEKEGGIYAGSGRGNQVARLVSLRNRGLVYSNGAGGRWHLTDAGREVLK